MRRAKGDGGIAGEKRVWTLLLAARDELRQMEREGVVPEGTAREISSRTHDNQNRE